ncbi:hypothetical protein HPB50_000676 [Hyalomma asiaticum]|uniref:Uncharacterized protein n=1 Tax=Hyalomma asiaticum TaxID=266040 RepID=A0ACB7SJI6_HYAAI|nr:hypothetical protein HPB50_000676 [Hyalomma asiaticum]
MSVDEARKLEQTSRQQSQSATWRAARKDRLTASNFGVAVSREKWTEKGLQNLTTDRDLSRVRAIQYGVSSEAVAVQKYETTLRTIRHNIQTFHCGLVVNPGCPWLGASPDRVVWDPEEQEPHGIVEIKCPYSMRDLKEPCIQGSCLIKDNNGTYRLNRTHCYYYQNASSSWDTELPSVSPCFQHTALVWLPCSVAWLLALCEARVVSHSDENSSCPLTVLYVTKLAFQALTFIVCVAKLVVSSLFYLHHETDLAEVAGASVLLCTLADTVLTIRVIVGCNLRTSAHHCNDRVIRARFLSDSRLQFPASTNSWKVSVAVTKLLSTGLDHTTSVLCASSARSARLPGPLHCARSLPF